MVWCSQATWHYRSQGWPRSVSSLGHKEGVIWHELALQGLIIRDANVFFSFQVSSDHNELNTCQSLWSWYFPSSHNIYVIDLIFLIAGFINLPLGDQMNLLQSTWLDVLCFNLAYRSVPYKGVLVFADDFQCTQEDSKKFGSPPDLDALTRKLAKKLSDLLVTKEEYVLLKAMLLLNPGERRKKSNLTPWPLGNFG